MHIADTQTHYQNAVILKGESARHIWDAFKEDWVTTYVGYPKRIKADQGRLFTSKLSNELTKIIAVELELSGVENHNSNGIEER